MLCQTFLEFSHCFIVVLFWAAIKSYLEGLISLPQKIKLSNSLRVIFLEWECYLFFCLKTINFSLLPIVKSPDIEAFNNVTSVYIIFLSWHTLLCPWHLDPHSPHIFFSNFFKPSVTFHWGWVIFIFHPWLTFLYPCTISVPCMSRSLLDPMHIYLLEHLSWRPFGWKQT